MSATTFSTRSGDFKNADIRADFVQLVRLFSGQVRRLFEGLHGRIDGILVQVDVHQAWLEVQRQRGFITDGIVERVARHVATFVFLFSKGPERVLVRLVDGRPRESEEERVGQAARMARPRSPSCVRCASSTNTTMFSRVLRLAGAP